MAWSGGSFVRDDGSTGCATDQAGGIGIESARMDNRFNDMTSGINATLNKAGQNTPSAHLTWVDTHNWAGTTAGTVNVQTCSCSPAITTYTTGMKIRVKAGLTNTSSLTLNVNSIGAKTVKTAQGSALTGGEFRTGYQYELVYDGTDLILLTCLGNSISPYEVVTATGSVQGDAAALSNTKFMHRIDGADNVKGVILTAPTSGYSSEWHIIFNNSAITLLKVYPESGGAIGDTGTNTAINIGAYRTLQVFRIPGLSVWGYLKV